MPMEPIWGGNIKQSEALGDNIAVSWSFSGVGPRDSTISVSKLGVVYSSDESPGRSSVVDENGGDVSSSESAGVKVWVKSGFGLARGDCEKRRLCWVVGEVRKGKHDLCYMHG